MPNNSSHKKELKKVRQELLESEERYRMLVEQSPDNIMIHDLEGTILFTNASRVELLGASSPEDIIGKNAMIFVHPESREFVMKTIGEALEDYKNGRFSVKTIEHKLVRLDGSEFYGEATGVPFIYKGELAIQTILRDITERKEAEGKLKRAYDELDSRVKERTKELSLEIEERKQTGEELERSRKKLRDLAMYQQNLQEDERGAIARDIHDDLGQILTAVNFELAFIAKKLDPDQSELLERTRKISALLKSSVDTIRRITSELRPTILDDLGLIAAMEWQAGEYHDHTNIDCTVISDSTIEPVEKDLSTALFRAFQEALTNAARHSGASVVSATIKKDVKSLILEIIDNGRGIRPEEITAKDSFGLIGMKERFLPFDGDVEINGIADEGTTIRISVPYK